MRSGIFNIANHILPIPQPQNPILDYGFADPFFSFDLSSAWNNDENNNLHAITNASLQLKESLINYMLLNYMHTYN